MDKLEFKGNWNQMKGKLKQKYGELSDDDLAYSEGQQEEFVGHLQEKLGKSRDAVIKELKSL